MTFYYISGIGKRGPSYRKLLRYYFLYILPAISKSSVPKPASVSTMSLATLSPTLYKPYRITTSIPSTRYLFWICEEYKESLHDINATVLQDKIGHIIMHSWFIFINLPALKQEV